jgi:hypothetical protein
MVKPFRVEFQTMAAMYLFDSGDDDDAAHLREIDWMEEIVGDEHQNELLQGIEVSPLQPTLCTPFNSTYCDYLLHTIEELAQYGDKSASATLLDFD